MSSACNSGAVRTIQTQLEELMQDPPPGVTAGPEDDDLFVWTGVLQGPAGTPYQGGIFFLNIKFPANYPYAPPRVTFITPVYHPNVSDQGDICLSILFQECSWDRGWSPAISISAVMLSLTLLLQDPNTDHSLRPELAAQYLRDRASYNAAARQATQQHAM